MGHLAQRLKARIAYKTHKREEYNIAKAKNT